jgi:hypothetical protein
MYLWQQQQQQQQQRRRRQQQRRRQQPGQFSWLQMQCACMQCAVCATVMPGWYCCWRVCSALLAMRIPLLLLLLPQRFNLPVTSRAARSKAHLYSVFCSVGMGWSRGKRSGRNASGSSHTCSTQL